MGMTTIWGPRGFNEFDPIGMLVEGFDQLGTMATRYNYAYYANLVGQYGFKKEFDFVEFRLKNIGTTPFPADRAARAETAKRRGGIRVLEFRNKKEMLSRSREFMALLGDIFQIPHSFIRLTEKQQEYYARNFLPLLPTDLAKLLVNKNDELIGFVLAMPSISTALRKARGRLFPFGFIHLYRALRPGNKVMDILIGGLRKTTGARMLTGSCCRPYMKPQRNGVSSTRKQTRCSRITSASTRNGITSNAVQHRRRRVYCKPIP